jgi:Vitamin K-dependent gamma-carboxylase
MPALNTALRRLVREEMDSRPMGIVRAAVGAAALLKLADATLLLTSLARPTAFRMPRFAELPMPSPEAMLGLLVLWFAAAVGLLLGWRTRLSGAVLTAVLGLVLALDQQLYASHLYLLFLLSLLLTLADSGAAVSLDARRHGGRPRIPAWPAVLMKVELTIVYAFSAVAKLNPTYLSGAVLAEVLREPGFVALPATWQTPGRLALLAWASVVLELVLACGLWSRRWRLPVAGAGVAFHVFIVLALRPAIDLVVFAIESLAVYRLFFDDRSPARIARGVDWALAERRPGLGAPPSTDH